MNIKKDMIIEYKTVKKKVNQNVTRKLGGEKNTMHEFCSHCDIRKTSLFEINQQLGAQMENLRAENENLSSQLRYYESSDVVDVVRCKDCKYFIEYTDEYMCRVEKANGECYIRLMNSDNEQYCACEYNDFCSRGRRREDG